MHKQRKFILIIAAIGAISVFLPWITVSAEGLGVRISESQNGFRGTGVLVFLAFAGAAILALMGDQSRILDKTMWMAAICAGAIALLFVVVHLTNTSNADGGLGLAGPGFGIWISLAASIGTLAAAWVFRNPGDTLKSGFESLKHDLGGLSGSSGPASGGSNTPNRNSSTESSNRMAELEKLIDLKNQGKISEEEYQSMKSKLL